jgi:hypothetical protein
MISQSSDFPIVALSVRVYQTLLVAYPTKFQQKYSSDMVDVFRSCCLRAVRQGGSNGMFKLWAITLLDLIQSVISEHAHKEIEMKKEMDPENIRIAGGALIWGAVTFVISLLSLSIGEYVRDITSPFFALSGLLMIFASMPLLVIGLLGVRGRYGDIVGRIGKNILLMGIILGSLISLIGSIGSLTGVGNGNINWILIYVGPAVLFAGLALFGSVALYKRPLPRWNVVPVIAGIWYPIITFSHTIMIWARTGSWAHGYPNFAMVSILDVIQGIALVALGYILKSDMPEETVAPA